MLKIAERDWTWVVKSVRSRGSKGIIATFAEGASRLRENGGRAPEPVFGTNNKHHTDATAPVLSMGRTSGKP